MRDVTKKRISRFRVLSWLYLMPSSLLLGACGTEEAPRDEPFTVRDSAGISITENSRELVDAAPELPLIEELRLGVVTGREEEEFFSLRDVSVDSEDRIFGMDMGARAIRVFDPDGEPIRIFGREGEGPGEFMSTPLRFTVGNDSVLVLDRYRLYLFDAEGEVLHTTNQDVAGNEIAPLLEHSTAGWIIGRTVMTRPSSIDGRVTRDTLRVWPIDVGEGQLGAPIVEVPGNDRWFLDDLARSNEKWLGPNPQAAVRSNGEIYLTDGASYEITVLSPGGEVLRRIRGDVARPPVTEAEHQAAIDQMMEYWDSLGMTLWADAFAEASRAGGRAELRPVPGQLLVAPGGRMLLERRDLDPDLGQLARDDTTTWDLIMPNGRISGRIKVGPRALVTELTDEALYVIERDEFDVQYLVRYRLAELY